MTFDPVPVHASLLPSGAEADAEQLNSLLASSSPAAADAHTLSASGAAGVVVAASCC